MNAHRSNYRPVPAVRPFVERIKTAALVVGIAAGLVLALLQPFGAITP